MKQLIFGLIFLTVAKSGLAQQATPQLTLKPRIADSLTLQFSKLALQPLTIFPKDSSRFSHFINSGKVFNLPQDNMPWLIPNSDLVDNMPINTDAGNSNMPNGLRSIPKSFFQFSTRKP